MKNAAGQIGMDPRAIVVAVLGLLLAPALALLQRPVPITTRSALRGLRPPRVN